jgi:hypothetical protein
VWVNLQEGVLNVNIESLLVMGGGTGSVLRMTLAFCKSLVWVGYQVFGTDECVFRTDRVVMKTRQRNLFVYVDFLDAMMQS